MKRFLVVAMLLYSSSWAAITFDGTASRLFVANYSAIQNLADLTISIWTYRTGDGGSSLGRIVDKRNAAADGSSAFVLFNDGAGTTYVFRASRWGTTAGDWTIARPSANAWHHVMVTYSYSATTNDPLIYVDGTSQTVTETVTPVGTTGSETENLNIGNFDAANRTWAGNLAEFALWNTILTSGNATSLAAGVSPLAISSGNLVSYAKMCNTSSPTKDYSSQGQNFTQAGSIVYAAHPASAPPCAAAALLIFEGRRR